tara:strand:+ start:10361 stop:11032 length:672 start_codon:yes stop_codon:yes gene_type:complete
MPKPLPWSYSSLDDFVNCPRSFYEKRITKSVKDLGGEHLVWGNYVHKAFEDRIKDKTMLPSELEMHETFMESLETKPGTITTERKIALNRKVEPCGFFDGDVWFRGVIDLAIVHENSAQLYDYKTGKPHSKFKQLKLFALHTFAEHPQVDHVHVRFYWTKTQTVTGENYKREQINKLWSEFTPDLKQYVEAFKTDTWQPRQSGLCNGWCPVTSCEFWKERRRW